MGQYTTFVPLGKLTVATPGTTIPLSTNCGTYGGQVQGNNPQQPAAPGNAWRAMQIQADPGNGGNLYILPRGNTATANPGAIMAKIGPGGAWTFPQGVMLGTGFLPENFVLDTDAGGSIAYGYGTLG